MMGSRSLRAVMLALALLMVGRNATAQTSATVDVDTAAVGAAVPADFTGLSFEMQLLLPDQNGQRVFRPDNQRLISLFKQLGIRNIRVGGNTADKPTTPVPGEADIDSLFAFAQAADAKIIYTLRLRGDYT